jgi:hypothetical protein
MIQWKRLICKSLTIERIAIGAQDGLVAEILL